MTRIKRAIVLFFVVAGLPAFALVLWVGYHLLILRDCVPDWTVPGAQTKCSIGFSEENFERIEPGMTSTEVVRLLGVPLKILENSNGRIKRMIDYDDHGGRRISFPDLKPGDPSALTDQIYYYTQQADPMADWLVRAIEFGPDGVAREVSRSVYFD